MSSTCVYISGFSDRTEDILVNELIEEYTYLDDGKSTFYHYRMHFFYKNRKASKIDSFKITFNASPRSFVIDNNIVINLQSDINDYRLSFKHPISKNDYTLNINIGKENIINLSTTPILDKDEQLSLMFNEMINYKRNNDNYQYEFFDKNNANIPLKFSNNVTKININLYSLVTQENATSVNILAN